MARDNPSPMVAIAGLSGEQIDSLYTAVVGDILDQMGMAHQFLPPRVRPITPGYRVFGRAMPSVVSDSFGNGNRPFGLLTDALDQLEPGEVYVATTGRTPCAAWGEILTETARRRGAVGAVIDGFHRDHRQVLATEWPVFSWGPYGQDAGIRAKVTDYRVPIKAGQVDINPGDLILGDGDGVVVIPATVEAEVLGSALEKISAENQVLDAISAGMSATEAFKRFGVL